MKPTYFLRKYAAFQQLNYSFFLGCIFPWSEADTSNAKENGINKPNSNSSRGLRSFRTNNALDKTGNQFFSVLDWPGITVTQMLILCNSVQSAASYLDWLRQSHQKKKNVKYVGAKKKKMAFNWGLTCGDLSKLQFFLKIFFSFISSKYKQKLHLLLLNLH